MMSGRRIILGLLAVGLLATLFVGQTLSQTEGERGQRGGDRGGDRTRMRGGSPEERARMMMERYKEMLGATDEEWTAINPKLTKVQTLSRQTRGMGGMGMLFGRGRAGAGARTGARGAQADRGARTTQRDREQTPVSKAIEALQKVLENERATPQQIKLRLNALRKAKEKVQQELAKAQKALREAVSLRQEAQLVLMGLLD